MDLTSYQQEVLTGLLNNTISKDQFAQIRSNSRRYNNLQRSVDLAQVFEVYKQRIKDEK